MSEKEKIRLDQLDKKMPFRVPENYFENFAANLEGQLKPKVAPKVHLYSKLRPYLFAAAIFVGVLLAGIPLYQRMQQKSAISTEVELNNYVLTEVDEELMIDYLADSELN